MERKHQCLADALAAAQGKMQNPTFDSANPHFRSKFASLASVRNAVVPALAAEGLAISQKPSVANGEVVVDTVLMYGNERDVSTLTMPVAKADAQGIGSAITYARRYALMAVCGVVGDDDDDGNQAVAKAQQGPAHAQQTASPETGMASRVARVKAAIGNADSVAELGAILAAVKDPALMALVRVDFEAAKNSLEKKGETK